MKTETAKEILSKHIGTSLYTSTKRGAEKLEFWILQAMIEYAELKCSEQRNICQQIFDLTDAQIGDVYKNAPKPKFK